MNTLREFTLADLTLIWEGTNYHPSFEKVAQLTMLGAWTDVAAKAKRLVQSGQVTILRNAPHHVMAHVIGDHGEYNCEISRSDPTSQIIEQWNCQCPWSQFAFDRTRKWKKLEGRVCSHVLAAYWKAKGVPLDVTDQDQGYQQPGGQKQGPAGPGQQSIPGASPEHPMMDQAMQPSQEGSPETPGLEAPATQPGGPGLPHQKDITIPGQPASPFTVPKQPATPQLEQLHLFDITAPPGAQPMAPTSPVSIPGGRPPTPTNPVQLPGTFSHWIPIIAIASENFIHYSADDMTTYFDTMRAAGKPIYVQLARTVSLEQSGGKIPVPGAQPYSQSSEGVPLYRVVDLGYNPELGRRMNADEGFQGAPEQQGCYSDAVGGKRGEILDWEPSLKMAYIFIPLDYPGGEDVRLHPHALKGWVDYGDIRPLANVGRPPYRTP